ncbi:YopX family protein [Staphylococcus epidermidis]|nr:YopX family protein [Staphylococcus epidermidis]MCG2117695.1 YopX family protein [Staphylococcus epidermidis]
MIPKFRAWDKNNKYMEYTDKNLVVCFSDEGASAVDHTTFGHSCTCMEDIELMQSTGLKDKNGTEIYEGDIVEFEDETSCYPFDDESSIGTINRAQIVIDNIQGVVLENFMLKNSTVAESYEDYYDLPTYEKAFFFTECRAIGNIYENPELLEDN